MLSYNIIIPVYNEEENVKLIYEQISKLDIYNDIKITFVDDGSTDNSLNTIKNIANKDIKVNFISFSKNFGHQIALSAGIDNSIADATIMMDADYNILLNVSQK